MQTPETKEFIAQAIYRMEENLGKIEKCLPLMVAFLLFSSHDMFLKMDTFFLKPNQPASIHLYNGTFEKSENIITRDRMQDVSLLGNGKREHLDSTSWTEVGNVTVLNFQTGASATWVAGVSTKARNIELSAEDFNEYLEHDGVLDELNRRKQNNTLDQPAVEKYSKHVKTIFQVGDKRTEDWKTPLGYPIEFVPVNNPYDLETGGTLQAQLLLKGKPLANQWVYAGFAGGGHTHEEGEEGEHRHDEDKMTTDANGLVSLKIDHGGQWYIRTIHMAPSQEEGLTHESNWATLTFEVKDHDHGHDHSHDHSHGLPSLAYWGVGLLFLVGLLFYLKKK